MLLTFTAEFGIMSETEESESGFALRPKGGKPRGSRLHRENEEKADFNPACDDAALHPGGAGTGSHLRHGGGRVASSPGEPKL